MFLKSNFTNNYQQNYPILTNSEKLYIVDKAKDLINTKYNVSLKHEVLIKHNIREITPHIKEKRW